MVLIFFAQQKHEMFLGRQDAQKHSAPPNLLAAFGGPTGKRSGKEKKQKKRGNRREGQGWEGA